jgi:MFS family permease
MPPFTESFGRRKSYFYSCAIYSIGCLITAVVPHTTAGVIVGRFISGLASAVPSVVVAGSIEDIYDARSRVWMM